MLFIHGSRAAMVMGHRLGFAAAGAGATAVTTHHSCKQHSSDLAHNMRGHTIHTNNTIIVDDRMRFLSVSRLVDFGAAV
jgi:hypothetical protein